MYVVAWLLLYLCCGLLCVAVNTFITKLQKPNRDLKVSEDELFICTAWPVITCGILLYLLIICGEWFVQFVVNFSAGLADRLREYMRKE